MKFLDSEIKLLKKLIELNGISCFEDEVRNFIKKEVKKLNYPFEIDNVGNIYAYKHKKENKHTILIDAHMDEIGFLSVMVKDYIAIAIPIGGINPEFLKKQTLLLKTKNNNYLKGKFVSCEKESIYRFKFNKEELVNNDVGAGCMIVCKGNLKTLEDNQLVQGKAFDDRFGVAIILETMKALKDLDLSFNVTFAFLTQEEVGLRGASICALTQNYDMSISLDCSPADAEIEGNGKLKGGFLIRHNDGSMVAFKEALELQKTVASNLNISYQDYFRTKGGTNAGALFKTRNGALAMTLCICGENIHTNKTVISAFDYHAAKNELIGILSYLDEEKINKLLMERK
ncbi:MAG: M28 family peptidase [Bacilli bacterium]